MNATAQLRFSLNNKNQYAAALLRFRFSHSATPGSRKTDRQRFVHSTKAQLILNNVNEDSHCRENQRDQAEIEARGLLFRPGLVKRKIR